MSAKYYIYRNLHTKTFSVRYRGKVIAHPEIFFATNVEFKVNQLGRSKVLDTQRKNVHAFIVCDAWVPLSYTRYTPSLKVHYNPYLTNSFLFAGKAITEYPTILGVNGKDIYLTTRNKNE